MEPTAFDINRFRERLAETVIWCSLSMTTSDILPAFRTEELRPSHGLETETERNFTPSAWTSDTTREYMQRSALEHPHVLCERQRIVDQVVEQRHVLLGNGRRPSRHEESISDDSGRLLVYMPDGTASDGAAGAYSHGFFDDDNVPPWDTWIDYVVEEVDFIHSYLISWVPTPLVALVNEGIEANPEQCILWVEHVDAHFVRQLRDTDMIG